MTLSNRIEQAAEGSRELDWRTQRMERPMSNEDTGIQWQGFKSAPYDLAAVKADNEAWAKEFRPKLVKRDEEERLARIAAEKLEAEKCAALEWCRSNGNPHRLSTSNQKDDE